MDVRRVGTYQTIIIPFSPKEGDKQSSLSLVGGRQNVVTIVEQQVSRAKHLLLAFVMPRRGEWGDPGRALNNCPRTDDNGKKMHPFYFDW